MQSKTSFFNRTVFHKCLTRYWPLWLGYAFVLFLTTPVAVLNRLSIVLYDYVSTPIQNLLLHQTPFIIPLLSCVFGLLMAAATFDFLFSARGTGLMASLPVRREGAFLSCYASGVVMLLSSDVLIALITLIVEAANSAVHLQSLLIWLAVLAMEGLLFYSIAVFCAMLTGHILVLPCLYLLLNVGAALLQALVAETLNLFVFGLDYSSWGLEILSPIIAVFRDTDVVYSDLYLSEDTAYSCAVGLEGWWTIGGWCIAGLLLAVCALLLYRRRRMECAGDTVAIPVLRPVLKYIVTVFCALGFPICICYLTVGSASVLNLPLYLVLTVAGVAIGYFASEMIIHKSFRVFRGRWKGLVITAVLFCALVCAAEFDLFGSERRVPEASSVMSVTIDSYDSVEFRSAENIQSVCALHQSIVANKSLHESTVNSRGHRIQFLYTLKNGKTLSRTYSIADDESQYTDHSDLRQLETLLNTDEARLSNENLHPSIPVSIETISYANVNYHDASGVFSQFELTPEEAVALYESAILPDCAAGTLGRRWFIQDETYARTVSDVDIYFEMQIRLDAERYDTVGISFTPLLTSEHTLAWLDAHDIPYHPLAWLDGNGFTALQD